jgi:Ca-activated chloride channel family protein
VLEPLVAEFARQENVNIQVSYEGSVTMMENLRDGSLTADAVWPASSFWIDLGDRRKKVRYRQSIYRTPVVFGVKRAVAQRLGWINRPVTVEQILKSAESGRLRFMMTSATQSNSGASAYLGYLYAFAGQPDVLGKNTLSMTQWLITRQ